MNKAKNHITVFEHETLRHDKGAKRITADQLKALQGYYGKGVPYYSLCYNGVQFNEYVGVIQVGTTVIEVLPKADKSDSDESKWRDILIGILKAVGHFEIKYTSESNLKIRPNTILDIYFEMFIKEVEYLVHNGLVKKYRKKEGNVAALKGSIQFNRHLQQNLIHQERFYVRHTTYDLEHKLHFILFKTIRLLNQINTHAALQSRISSLLLNFPEMPDIRISESTFDHLVFNRKTKVYSKAIEIARLILLQYHPDLTKGRNHVLALMFDMNRLWEQFVFVSLRKNIKEDISITAQKSRNFWKPEYGHPAVIRPDIVITRGDDYRVILDTKWKSLNGYNPSPDDLRQMYTYHEYFDAKRVALVYPGNESGEINGFFFPTPTYLRMDKECSVITLAVPEIKLANKSIVKTWQDEIKTKFEHWMDINP